MNLASETSAKVFRCARMRKFPVAAFECSTAVLHHPCESFVVHVYLKDSTLTLTLTLRLNPSYETLTLYRNPDHG